MAASLGVARGPGCAGRAKVLNKRLGDVQVSRFTTETILAHVRERKADGIANATINRELAFVECSRRQSAATCSTDVERTPKMRQ
jgi:hypothetical protein